MHLCVRENGIWRSRLNLEEERCRRSGSDLREVMYGLDGPGERHR